METEQNTGLASSETRGEARAATQATPTRASRLLGYAVLTLAAALLSLWLLNVAAGEAFAQGTFDESPPAGGGGEGGDAITNTLNNIRNYLAGLLVLLGSIGLAGSFAWVVTHPINDRAQAQGWMGVKTTAGVIVVGTIIGPIVSILVGLAG